MKILGGSNGTKNNIRKREKMNKVRMGIRTKFLAGLVVALLIGPTIAALVTNIVQRLDTEMGNFVQGNFSLYLSTGINLIVVSGLILALLHFVVLKPLRRIREFVHTASEELKLDETLKSKAMMR
ncbi:MAG TPA: hypothetical protein DHN33_04915 [Eubacteriaceae bacterium]|nr:hypothetical protein [Eubacteriaceae bacterium]